MALKIFGKKRVKKQQSTGIFNSIDIPINVGSPVFQNDLSFLEYYLTIPELFSVISAKANMFSSMKLDVVSKKTSQSMPLTNPLQKILKSPNWHQGQKEFLKQTKTFRELYGNEYLHFTTPIGFSESVKQINTLDPIKLRIELNQELKSTPLFLIAQKPEYNYTYNWQGRDIFLSNTDILQINNPVVDTSTILKGVSQIQSVLINLNNIVGAYESRKILIFNRGALGILTNDSSGDVIEQIPVDETSKELLQQQYKKYGLTGKQWQLLITNMKLKFQRMALSPKDLMLFEEIESDFQSIIGVFGLRREMFPTIKGTTFENQKQAEKASYTNTIIPEAQEWVSALNTFFKTETKSYIITADFSHLPIFAEDLKEKGTALRNYISALDIAFQNGALSIEDYKNILNDIL